MSGNRRVGCHMGCAGMVHSALCCGCVACFVVRVNLDKFQFAVKLSSRWATGRALPHTYAGPGR